VRLFIAIDIPEEIKKNLLQISFGIPGAKWMEDDQIHLTLRFIGEVLGNTYLDITEALKHIKVKPFSIQLKGIGHFPPRKHPKVLWVGVEKSDELFQLKKKIDHILNTLHLDAEDRKFHPHITLARLKNSPASRVGLYIAENNLFKTEPIGVHDFHLYSSILNEKGALHQKEASYNLN